MGPLFTNRVHKGEEKNNAVLQEAQAVGAHVHFGGMDTGTTCHLKEDLAVLKK